MDREINKTLKLIGLPDNEIKVYVSLLKIGESTAHAIAKNSGLPRTTIYHIIDSLSNKGLISSIVKKNVKRFKAASPKRLEEITKNINERVIGIMPALIKLSSQKFEKPNILIFEGKKGVRSALQSVLDQKKEIYHYGDVEALYENIPYIFPNFIMERIKKKIPIKIIGKKKHYHKKLIKSSKKEYRSFTFLPDKFCFESSIFIFDDKVAIFVLKEEPYYALIIKNKSFYQTQKTVFDFLRAYTTSIVWLCIYPEPQHKLETTFWLLDDNTK